MFKLRKERYRVGLRGHDPANVYVMARSRKSAVRQAMKEYPGYDPQWVAYEPLLIREEV